METKRTPFEFSDEELRGWAQRVYDNHRTEDDVHERRERTCRNMVAAIAGWVQMDRYSYEEGDTLLQKLQQMTGLGFSEHLCDYF